MYFADGEKSKIIDLKKEKNIQNEQIKKQIKNWINKSKYKKKYKSAYNDAIKDTNAILDNFFKNNKDINNESHYKTLKKEMNKLIENEKYSKDGLSGYMNTYIETINSIKSIISKSRKV